MVNDNTKVKQIAINWFFNDRILHLIGVLTRLIGKIKGKGISNHFVTHKSPIVDEAIGLLKVIYNCCYQRIFPPGSPSRFPCGIGRFKLGRCCCWP